MKIEHLIIALIIFTLFAVILLKLYSYLYSYSWLEDEDCKHQNTFTSVKNVTANCETTTVECLDCGKQLRKPKTDCT